MSKHKKIIELKSQSNQVTTIITTAINTENQHRIKIFLIRNIKNTLFTYITYTKNALGSVYKHIYSTYSWWEACGDDDASF